MFTQILVGALVNVILDFSSHYSSPLIVKLKDGFKIVVFIKKGMDIKILHSYFKKKHLTTKKKESIRICEVSD